MLSRVLSLLFRSKTASGAAFNPFRLKAHFKVVEKYNIDAHFYMPSIGNTDNGELCKSLDELASAGYVMTDRNGVLIGKLAKSRLNAEEKAILRRATFKIVE